MLDFLLSLKDEDGKDISYDEADILYEIISNFIENTDEESDDIVRSVAMIILDRGFVFDYDELVLHIQDEL